jgi:hypothetical protein
MKSAPSSSAQAQIGSSPGSGKTISVRLTGTKLASSRNRLMILPINSRRLLTRNTFGEEFRSQLIFSTTHFFESVLFGFCFRSFKSLLRPKACLLATRSSREMKFTGTSKKVLATLFLHASRNATPVISVRYQCAPEQFRSDRPPASRRRSPK